MKRLCSTNFLLLILTCVVTLCGSSAHAQNYPDKPITLVVPYPAGSLADLFGRAVANDLQTSLKQPVIVDNRAGANQVVGASYTARAQPDGYTLLVTAQPSVIPASVQNTLPFHSLTDFEPVASLLSVPMFLAVKSDLPASNLKELVTLLKASPDKYTFGSSGVGSPIHLFAEMFNKEVGVKQIHVPYKSYQNALTDMMSGLIDYCFLPLNAMEFVTQGKLKAIASSGGTRDASYPNLPTLNEAGIKGFEMSIAYLIVATKGTPAPIIKRLNTAINAAISTDAFATKVKPVGGVVIAKPGTPSEAGNFIAKEEQRWNALVKSQNIDLTNQ